RELLVPAKVRNIEAELVRGVHKCRAARNLHRLAVDFEVDDRAHRSNVVGNETALVIDVVLELVAEMLDEALHRQRRGVAERADGSSRDVVRDRCQQLEIAVTALAVLDAVQTPPQPSGALPAGRALTA